MYKIISTFTGGGGLDIGFHGGFTYLGKKYKRLKFRTEVAVDINSHACKTLEADDKYFKDGHYDVLLGGFPCVSFSIVGKQTGVKDDLNGKLYESYAKYVEHFKPKVFLAENVKGILSANKGEAIKIIKKRFEDTGYKLKIFLVNFADFGVPQLRERVLFVGVREDIETNIYRKLDRNKPAYTVIASGGGGTWTYHFEEPRALTNRERARLQGFPDDFKFQGTNTEIRRQIGNAVPAVGIHPFAERIQNVLDGVIPDYNSSEILPEYDTETRRLKQVVRELAS